MRVIALLLGIVGAWLGVWIYLRPPNYFFLAFAVGGPEVIHWTILGALVGSFACRVPSRKWGIRRTELADRTLLHRTVSGESAVILSER
jgi:uncharacterized membrane protein YeaQ/YmgE (transglycosylase-associated protein family)